KQGECAVCSWAIQKHHGKPNASAARRRGTVHSHPARVLLRHEAVAGSFVGAPPPVRTGQAHIRTRGGCSYDTRWWQACCRSTAPGANGAGTHSHPRRVLLRYGVVAGVFVGAPPDRRTARCEPVKHVFAPGAGAPTSEAGTRAMNLNSTHYPIPCRLLRW